MIIYNLKGLLVGVAVVIIALLCAWMDLSMGVAFLLAGLIGLFLSVKLTVKGEGFLNAPSVFFIPTHVYTALIIIISVFLLADEPSFFDKTRDDYRTELYERDASALDTLPISGIDSIATRLDIVVTMSLLKQLKPENISYRVQANTAENKALVLVKFPKIDDLEKDARGDFVNMLEEYLVMDTFFRNKKVYIGVTNKNNSLKVTKVPERGLDKTLAVPSNLYPFYADTALAKPTI